jgi:hypothetical protein
MCLNDIDVQMLADGEALPEAAAHVKSCDRCAARVAARQRLIADVAESARRIDLPPARADAIKRQLQTSGLALSERRRGESKGGTTLRQVRSPRRTGWAAAAAALAATLLLIAIVPRLNRTETVSAAEILGRSHAALATTTTGIEILTYDLALEGVLAHLLPQEQAGRFTVEEAIDHDHPGRFRAVKLAPDGTPVAGAVEDPVAGERVRYIRAHGRGYLLRFSATEPLPLSLPAIKRAALQTFVTVMQGQPKATVNEAWRAGERVFVVEIPQDRVLGGAAPFSLTRGRAVIAADDARLLEVDAAGTLADQTFSISFVLRDRRVQTGPAAPEQFQIAPRPGDLVLDGTGTTNPAWDVVTTALQGLSSKERTR